MDKEDFEKVVVESYIKDSKETFEFLRQQALEIFNECKDTWMIQQPYEDKINENLWNEFSFDAQRKLQRYLMSWFWDVSSKISFQHFHKEIPYELCLIFENWMDVLFQNITFQGLSEEMINEIFKGYKNKNGKGEL